MTYSSAPTWRRWLLGALALTAASLVSLPSETHALTICEDYGGVPEQLDGFPPELYWLSGFSGVGPFDETVTTFLLPGGDYYDEFGSITIEDLDVSVKLHHARIEDVSVWIRHTIIDENGGTDIVTVPLMVNPGCAPTDFNSGTIYNQDVSLYFDDSQVANIDFACDRTIPSLSGRHSPSTAGIVDIYTPDARGSEIRTGLDSLAGRIALGGEGVSAYWELIVIDYGVTIDAGALIEWCMVFNDQEEGDIAPREETSTISPSQSGNGAISVADYVGSALFLLGYLDTDFREMERLVANLAELAGLPTPDASGFVNGANPADYVGPIEIFFNDDLFENIRRGSGLEYSILDTAPGTSGGDGLFTVADWVQTTRYAAGISFDEPVKAGGALAPSDRIVSVGNTIIPRGREEAIPVYLQSKGVEHEIAFGLSFDPTLLQFERAQRGDCLPGNAIFQLTNEGVANEEGIFGLQVGLLPDQTFLCDYRQPPDVLANGETEIDDVEFNNRGTAPLSLLYDVSTEFDQVDFDAQFPDTTDPSPGYLPEDIPNNPIVTLNVYANRGEGNEVEDPIQDFLFDFAYSADRLEPIDGSLTLDDDFIPGGSPDSSSFSWTGATSDDFIGFGTVSALSTDSAFVDSDPDGPLFSIQFRVIVADTAPDSPFFSPSTAEPWFLLRKGDQTAINASIVGEGSALYRARFFSSDTNPIYRPPVIRVLDEDGNSLDSLPALDDRVNLYFVVQNNLRTVSSYDYQLDFPLLPWLDLLSVENAAPDSNTDGVPDFRGRPNATPSLLVARRYFIASIDSESTFLNGSLNRLVFDVASPPDEGGQVEVSANDNLFFSSGFEAIRALQVINYTYDDTKSAESFAVQTLDVEDASEAADEKVAQFGPTLSTNILAITPVDDENLAIRTGLDLENNTEEVDRYAFVLTYDSDVLELGDLVDGETGGTELEYYPVVLSVADPAIPEEGRLEYFRTLVPAAYAGTAYEDEFAEHLNQAFTYYYDVYVQKLGEDLTPLDVQDMRANYSSVIVAGIQPDGASAFTSGRLLEVNYTIDRERDIVTAPSAYFTEIPPVNERVEIAKLYFTALPGDGAVVTPLEFQPEPIFFAAPTVRNVAGVPIYSSFANAGVTIIDNSDVRPTVRVRDTVLAGDTEGTLQIILESVGVENAAGFTLEFDNSFLEIITASAGRHIPTDGFFYTYPNIYDIQRANDTGKLAILTSLQPGGTFEEGDRIIANLLVKPLMTSDAQQTTTVSLTALYDRAEVVDPFAIPVVTRFPDSVVSVSGEDCQYVLDPPAATDLISTIGGEGQFLVDVTFLDNEQGSGCPWTAITSDDWIDIVSGGSGVGDGVVEYIVGPNSGGQRTGYIEVVGQRFEITQQGCTVTVTPESQLFASPGGTGLFEVLTEDPCPWVASSNNSWIIITSDGFGTGDGIIDFEVERNVGIARAGTITVTVGGEEQAVFTVNQEICRYEILDEGSGEGVNVSTEGGEFQFELRTTLGADDDDEDACPWTADTEESWIIIPPESQEGVGDAIIEFTVQVNTGEARTGIVRVEDLTYIVSQEGNTECDYELDPVNSSFSAGGGEGEFAVITTETCSWSVETEEDWITITSDETSVGPGTVTYIVEENDGVYREGIIAVGSLQHIVQQFGGAFVFEFREDEQGWVFETINPPFTEPVGVWDVGTSAMPGSLDIITSDNTNTFGDWASPNLSLSGETAPENLFEVAFNVSSDVDPEDTAEQRLRVSSPDFERTDVFVSNSLGSGNFAPTSTGRTYNHLASLPEGRTALRAYWDVLNFNPVESVADQTMSLERVRIGEVDPLRVIDPVLEKRYVLASDTDAADWTSHTALPLGAPVFSVSDRGLVIASGYTTETGLPTIFGYWHANSGVTIASNRIYRLRFTVSSRSEVALPVRKRLVPTFRMRMNASNAKQSAYVNIESINDESRVPTFLENQSYDLWFQAPGELVGSDILLSFDYLFAPEAFNDPAVSLVLEVVEITSYELLDPEDIEETPTPTPEPTPEP